MSYSIKWTPQVLKDLEKLPGKITERIINKIEELKFNPFHYLEHYGGADVYKLRVGDYRALIDVDFSKKILKVRIVGHRKNIYKKF